MDENDSTNLDTEFKRYLQIMRPYLGQISDQTMVEICNAWIQRLSRCSDNEKKLRNKYVFVLYYHLARGILEEPFNRYPHATELPPLSDDISDDSSTEFEYFVIDAENDNNKNSKVLFNNKRSIASGNNYYSEENNYYDDLKARTDCSSNEEKNKFTEFVDKNLKPTHKQSVLCYTCPDINNKYMNYEKMEEKYENRTNNLVLKLREIKTQNMLLHNELQALKEESQIKSSTEDINRENVIRVDNSTSAYCSVSTSSSTLKSLKFKLQEVQESKNSLIATIEQLQENLNDFNEIKRHEIEDIEANHKLEMITTKSKIREEIKNIYEKKLEEQKQFYETKIKEMQCNIDADKQCIDLNKDSIISEKEKEISAKDTEIAKLKSVIEEQKNNLDSVLNKLAEKPTDANFEENKTKAEQLEKRLCKLERSKSKCIRMYEARLAHLQREKHLAECSLQLQLVRQRAQVINEIADENQAELVTTLDKLETKYKEIIANIQSTAIQRRVHDQMTLDSIIQAAIKSENMYANGTRGTNRSQVSGRTMQNQGRDENQSYDSEMSSLLRGNKVGNVIVGNKSFGEDSVMAGYCLDGERMGQLFERVYIPQRDTGDGPLKK